MCLFLFCLWKAAFDTIFRDQKVDSPLSLYASANESMAFAYSSLYKIPTGLRFLQYVVHMEGQIWPSSNL